MARTSRLSDEQAAALKADIVAGMKQTDIAKKYEVSRSLVSDIATERTHTRIPWPEGEKPLPKQPGGQHKPVEEYDPTDERVQQLEAEVVHLTEERNLERRRAKANAKQQGLFKAMADELEDSVIPMTPLPKAATPFSTRGKIEEHCVLHLSDGHHDQVVRPEECGGLERYNFPISCCRGERLIDTLLQWTQQTLASNFRFPVLDVLAYGDFTSGEIHGATGRSYFRNQFKNSCAIGQLHALMYRDMAPYFDQINVIYVPGNHGRRSRKKDYHGAHDNWDYLVAKMAELYCADMENVSFLIPDCFSVNLDINGVGFNIAHGDDVRGALGIPYYGLQRKQRNLSALAHLTSGPRVRYYCQGHFHRAAMLGDIDGELIMNGPWVATDAYAYESLSAYTEPNQWIHGVNPKYGITWRLDAKMKNPSREAKGPQRYNIIME